MLDGPRLQWHPRSASDERFGVRGRTADFLRLLPWSGTPMGTSEPVTR
jgi:hypothetical protein